MPTRPRLTTAAAVAVLVLLAGCGASSSGTKAAGRPASHHQAQKLHHHKHGAGKHGAAKHSGAAKRHHSKSAGSSTVGSGSSSPRPSASATSVKHGSTGGSPSSSASQSGPQPVVPGTYTYDQTGSQKAAGFTSSVPPTSSLVVHPATASGEQTTNQKAGGKDGSDQTLLYNSKGMFLISEVEHVPLPGHAETITCRFNPGVPYPPWPLRIGATAQAHTKCGSVNVSAKGDVTERRTTTVHGVRLTVYVVKVTLTTSGQITSTSTDTEWFAPSLRLVVRDASTISGKYGPFGFTGSFTRTLTSTTPH
jgi:hypothetical protein